MRTQHDPDLWKKAIDGLNILHQATKDFPQPEMDGLTNQTRQSAMSMPSTVAEGDARKSTIVFLHFLSIAKGDAAEPETQSIIVKHLGSTDGFSFEAVDQMLGDLRILPAGCSWSIEKRSSEQSNH